MKRLCIASYILSLCLILGIGCKKDKDKDEDDSTINIQESQSVFTEAAKLVLPVFQASQSLHLTSDFTWGNINYEMFVALGDPQAYPEWGNKNLYNNINMMDMFVSNITNNCDNEINKTITPPFDFGSSTTKEYKCAKNDDVKVKYNDYEFQYSFGAAWTKTDSKVDVIFFGKGEKEHLDIGGIEGSYDETSGDLTLNQVGYTSYLPEDSPNYTYTGPNKGRFIPRMYAKGNTKTHEFELKVINYNPGAADGGQDGYNLFMVGKGISKGSGNYFLFKVKDNNKVTTEQYFCFPADASVTTIQNLQGTTYENINANCAQYKEDVKNMSFFTNEDVPSEKFEPKLSW